MIDALPKYTPAALSGSAIDQIGQFEDILLEAGKEGVINDPPNSEAETYNIESQRIRLQTIAERLYLLGYLRNKIKPNKIDKKLEEIREAVFVFQNDANLKKDHWVGNKTWFALDELVSFESEFTYDQWFVNDRLKPEVQIAMHRAIQLRLWCLGLYSKQPRKKFDLLKKASLFKFGKILKIFLFEPKHFPLGFNVQTLKILFNQDILTDAIVKRSSPKKKSFMLQLSGQDKEGDRNLSNRYIVNCAKIELWLLGFKVDIDGKDDFLLSKQSDLYKAIFDYYQQFENCDKKTAKNLAGTITPKLFVGIGAANEINDSFDLDDASEEIAKSIGNTAQINKAWSYIKNKGMRLWDGLKRVWRWIKMIGKKVSSFIENNVFKGFFRYTSKAYKIIKLGMIEVVKSIQIYLKGQMNSSNVQFYFSKDMDTTTYFSKNISSEDAELGLQKLLKQSKAFRLGCRMIGFLLGLFVKLATTFVGWARLLFSLLKGYKELRLLYLDLKALAV